MTALPVGPCIEWPGRRTSRGYGLWYAGRRLYGTQYPHRAVWIERHGPIPIGLEVDHICFNPPCVNLEHLQLLTRSENAKRRRTWLMHKAACPQGHPYDEENKIVVRRTDGREYWRCRLCARAASAKWNASHHDNRLEYWRRYREKGRSVA